MIDPNAARWIFASVSKYFADSAQTAVIQIGEPNKGQPLPLDIEGQPPITSERQAWAEFRLDGPEYREPGSKGTYSEYHIAVSILITVVMNDTDLHQIYQYCGDYASLFVDTIPVYRYGDGPQDDKSIFGCFQIRMEGLESVFISHFGQVDENVRVLQSTVDARYKMTI